MFTAAAPRHDPVELRPSCAPDADGDDDVRAERDRGEREWANDPRRLVEGGSRDPVDDPGERSASAVATQVATSTRYVST